ncbi:MAG: PstS family phosphate ABC transporter substrate-binding protein [Planctomycetes bacterium]|nr:PstS family phosphate ABC transporter substrate-binding protein [Planctomycetota bacterium]
MKYFHILTLSLLALSITSCGQGVNGAGRAVLQNKGSDTLVNVAQAWAEHYSEVNPSIAVAVTGGGSGTGISSMINGTVDIANSSRAMKERELEAARSNGIEPLKHIVGYDALAVYVHPDNPIESISMDQLRAIYGEGGEVTTWSQMGVKVPENANEIVRVSRQNNSGTYAYFKEAVLGKTGEYKLGSLDLHGSKDVVELCEKTRGAIGYSGLAYATDHVKLVPVVGEGGAPVVPTVLTAIDGSYPIARPLFMYTAGEPEGFVKEYLDWIMSPEGQGIIFSKGYAPVDASVVQG